MYEQEHQPAPEDHGLYIATEHMDFTSRHPKGRNGSEQHCYQTRASTIQMPTQGAQQGHEQQGLGQSNAVDNPGGGSEDGYEGCEISIPVPRKSCWGI